MTTLAVYVAVFFSGGGKLEQGHPLSTVPDNFGEFDPAVRKKVSAIQVLGGRRTSPRLSALNWAGRSPSAGQIEVEPLRIREATTRHRVTVPVNRSQSEKKKLPFAFVLTLRVKNNSDVPIYPMDPAFTRKSCSVTTAPITRLDKSSVSRRSSPAARSRMAAPGTRSAEEIRSSNRPTITSLLPPGELSAATMWCSPTPPTRASLRSVESAKRTNAVARAQAVQQRESITFRGKELPVTAIIGVDFKASDIKELDLTPG